MAAMASFNYKKILIGLRNSSKINYDISDMNCLHTDFHCILKKNLMQISKILFERIFFFPKGSIRTKISFCFESLECIIILWPF